ncbi:hypothetical protein N7509_007817 [Penicillium cosmopolitanum]|uniref:G-patch domain-containing protein n=1 Tax=Penicillium cosmopolitanum TaxID=1131564 RepID=A0A9W9VZT5_9EURO|nr:uncharacterized protein N7509_007817 [Penicillium cosmopolitanum]KAJ5392327.1 hypothetical protein N7509_007817 [Penicillium cosmopolitanum]
MSPNHGDTDEGEEDDYMSMVIEEPKFKETFTQRKRREQREAEARGKVPSKAERAAEEAARREEALSKSTLDPANKGFKMMAKLGFKPGQSLGKRDTDTDKAPGDENKDDKDRQKDNKHTKNSATRSEPLNLIFKEDRGGIGMDEQKKRKIRDYRDRVREERELKRTEAQVRAAQKVVERLDTEEENNTSTGASAASADASASSSRDSARDSDADTQTQSKANDQDGGVTDNDAKTNPNPNADYPPSTGPKVQKPKHQQQHKPTAQINVLYRGLVRERENHERDKQARHALHTSLPSSFFPKQRLPTFSESELERDPEDEQALGTRLGLDFDPYTAAVEQELEEEDPELEAFNELPPSERLHKLVLYLRETYRYCFWCKYRYERDDELEGVLVLRRRIMID